MENAFCMFLAIVLICAIAYNETKLRKIEKSHMIWYKVTYLGLGSLQEACKKATEAFMRLGKSMSGLKKID